VLAFRLHGFDDPTDLKSNASGGGIMMKKLMLIFGLLALAMPALADMSGGDFQILSPNIIFPGQTDDFAIEVCNNSPDGEWTNEVRIYVPQNWDILDGWYDDQGQGWDFNFSIGGDYNEIGIFLDADGDRGEIEDGQCGIFYVRVYLHENVDCVPVAIRGKQIGDGVGAPPHLVEEYMSYLLCVIPVEESNWSTVKSLY